MTEEIPQLPNASEHIDEYRDKLHERIAVLRQHPDSEDMRPRLDAFFKLTQETRDQGGLQLLDALLARWEGQLSGADPNERSEQLRASIAVRLERLEKRPDIGLFNIPFWKEQAEKAQDQYHLEHIDNVIRDFEEQLPK